ncbi:hypothetical protein OIU78_003121 [Salix suchowensis]|nr:hypothetical protein OIU78_003121 [Salix suchowensis]
MALHLNHFYPYTSKHGKQPKPPLTSARPRPTKFQVRAASINARELIQSGAVRPIPPKEAAMAMSSEDIDSSPITLLKKWVHFGYVGLWTGQNFTTLNPDFLRQVEAEVPDKDAKLLVACGEGLRSIMAASKLYAGGFKNLGWLAGGFNRSADSDFPAVEGSEKLQYATIGGVSYFFLQLLILLRAVGKDD